MKSQPQESLTTLRMPCGCRARIAAPFAPGQVNAIDWEAACALLCNNPALIHGFETLKQSRHERVFRAQFPGAPLTVEVVCKQGAPRGLWARFRRKTRARREFEAALALTQSGIATARPVGLLQERVSNSEVFISEFVGDARDLDDVALQRLPAMEATPLRQLKNALISKLAEMIAALERNGFGHRDFKASNILVREWSDPHHASVLLIDLEGVQPGAHTRIGEFPGAGQAVRLAASLIGYPHVTRSDAGRLMRDYLRSSLRSAEYWKTWTRSLLFEAEKYSIRAQTRKRGKLDGYPG